MRADRRYGAGRRPNKAAWIPLALLHLAKAQVARIPWGLQKRQPLLHLPRIVDLRVLEPKKRQHAAEDPKSRVPMLNTSPSSPGAQNLRHADSWGVSRMDELEQTFVPCSKHDL